MELMRIFAFSLALLLSHAQAEVRLINHDGRFELRRDGKPFFVKGAGGDERAMASLAKAGGNTLRLWGDDRLGEMLNQAQQNGLTVIAGIWLGQVRQGFDWSDADSLIQQRKHIREVVLKHKDHPALLCWALGNEMEDKEGKNGAVWTVVNNLAVMVKQLDPAHPTMTVIAEIGGQKVRSVHALCPEIDILGINSYCGAASLPERYRKAGGTKPYLLTEFGPAGIWEVKKNSIAAYEEPTSTEKAKTYRQVYEKAVLGEPALCLGSCAFLWGQKQEVTATWFSMLLTDGTRLGPADVMQELWSGSAPTNRCPEIRAINVEGSASLLDPAAKLHAKLEVTDPEDKPLRVEWMVQRDHGEYGTGGDAESVPPTFPTAITRDDAHSADITLPGEPGLYRLFATVRDEAGGGATANVPLRIRGEERMPPGKKPTLPFIVYAEGDETASISSGWMGDTKSLQLDPKHPERPHAGKAALKCAFSATSGWCGVAWQSPAGDWGDRGGGHDLSGASKVTFWARGESGGEVVSFKFGILGKEKRFHDTASGALENVALSKDWQRYEIAASGDLTRIKTAFSWSTASNGQPVVFYVDEVRWE